MWTPLHEIPLITICTSFTPLLLCFRLSTTHIHLLMLAYVPGYTVCYFYPLFKNSMLLCHFRKKKPFKRALWNKNVLTSHKIRSLLDSQFTTSPYFIFLKTISKLLTFSFMPTPVYFFAPYLLESLWPCSLRKNKLSCFLFWNLTFGARDTTIPVPFLPSLETPVSSAGLLCLHTGLLWVLLCAFLGWWFSVPGAGLMIIMDLALVSCKYTFSKLHFLTLVISKLN